jgi:putative spermidine/putrescine transport system substrate-binding protein
MADSRQINRRPFTRRVILKSSAALIVAYCSSCSLILPGKARATERLVVTSRSGSYRAAMEAAIIFPFTKEIGLSVTVVDSADIAKIKSQAASKKM